MVLAVVQEMSHSLEHVELSVHDCKDLLDSLWTMYEALPAHIPSATSASHSWLPKLENVEVLSQDLVGIDILSRWPGCRPFAFYAIRQRHRSKSNGADVVLGDDIIAQLCRAFCLKINEVIAPNQRCSFLHDLLSDVEHFNEGCCGGSLVVPTELCTNLVRPLLQLEQFHLVTEYLGAKPELLDREQVKQAVLDYVDDAVFSESEDSTKIMSAMKCQDIIGPVFADIQPGFLSIRRYLDASHFLATVIYEGRARKPFKPSDLRRTLPLDVVESVLQEVPESAVCGCPEWMDRVFARDANKTFRQAIDQKAAPGEGSSGPTNLPALPGGAIFHLATILGLDDDMSALVVKCRVIHHAMRGEELQGAAAAVCRTLVREGDPKSLGDGAVALCKLGAVAEVVSDDSYADLSTKKELCHAALQKFKDHVSVVNSDAFDTITRVFSILDHRSSRFNREQQDLTATRQHILMSRPLARLNHHVLSEYNADVHALFSDLLGQTSQGLVHDSLMNALSRFVIYWSISDSKTLKLSLDRTDKLDARDNLDLGCSLILHIPSKLTAMSCVHELQKIAADQAANVSTEERFGSDDEICIPDPQIVRQLIGRGYTDNAARRAAVMTRNQSYKDALGWAVTHTYDADFNEPVLILKVPNRRLIDEDAIQSLQKRLFMMNRYLEESGSYASFLHSISEMHGRDSQMRTSVVSSPTRHPKLEARPRSFDMPKPKTASSDSGSNRPAAPPPVPPPVPPTPPGFPSKRVTILTRSQVKAHSAIQLPMYDTDITNGQQRACQIGPSTQNGNTIHSESMQEPETKSEMRTVQKLPAVQQTRVAQQSAARRKPPPPPPATGIATRSGLKLSQIHISKTAGNTRSALSPRTPIGASPTSALDRSELRKRGQAALVKLRSRGSPEDRRRLIEEGRQLLQQARSKVTALPPSTRESSKPRRAPPSPLRAPPSTRKEESKTQPPERLPATSSPAANNDLEGGADSGWDFDDFDDDL
jgi:hypothetical protein